MKDEDIEWDWAEKPERRKELIELYDKMITPCDYPLNMAITGLVTNAYLYTGEEKYKKWVEDYVSAWMDRIEENNGIIPDNVGRTGKIGEYRDGLWWGGVYGWTSRYSVHIITTGMITGMQCALLVSGDSRYIDLLRSQVDMLLENSKTVKGQLLIPYKYGLRGWWDYRPLSSHLPAYIWHASMEPDDWKNIGRLVEGTKYHALPGEDVGDQRPSPNSEMWLPDFNSTVDVTKFHERLDRNGDELPHVLYLGGENPGWADDIMDEEYRNVSTRLERLLDDSWESNWKSQTVLQQNPVLINGLVQMTMGAPSPGFNGGLLRARVRYFDSDCARPGLPPDVAALVEKIEAGRTVVQLVNTSAFDTRKLIIQAGAFGEHEFTTVTYQEQSTDSGGEKILTGKTVPVNNRYFAVELPPATSIKLDIGTRRFVNKPSYAFPWH